VVVKPKPDKYFRSKSDYELLRDPVRNHNQNDKGKKEKTDEQKVVSAKTW